MNSSRLKRGLLIFWALWMTIVVSTNCLDAMKSLGWLPTTWKLRSSNYKLIRDTTAPFRMPTWANAVLFAGVIVWEALSAVLLWRAGMRFRATHDAAQVYPAFAVNLSLWAAFMLADELFIAPPVEAAHTRFFIAQLTTLLAIQLLPAEKALDQ